MKRVDLKLERKRRRNKTINHWIIALIVIFSIAFACVANMDKITTFMANFVQTVELGKTGNKNSKKANYNFKQVKPVSPKSIAEAYAKSSSYRPVGQLSVPNLQIHQNIYEGVGNVELNIGVGTLKPHQKLGKRNYAVAGHNMDDGKSYLSPLFNAMNSNHLMNQMIYVTDFKNVYYYKVVDAKFISKYRTDLISDKGFGKVPVFTMITCDATGAGRLYVCGLYQGKVGLNKAPSYVQKSFIFKK